MSMGDSDRRRSVSQRTCVRHPILSGSPILFAQNLLALLVRGDGIQARSMGFYYATPNITSHCRLSLIASANGTQAPPETNIRLPISPPRGYALLAAVRGGISVAHVSFPHVWIVLCFLCNVLTISPILLAPLPTSCYLSGSLGSSQQSLRQLRVRSSTQYISPSDCLNLNVIQ